jgi:hypothetical protein
MIKTHDILDNKSLFSFRDKNLINDLYQYYFYNGFHSILTEKVIRLSLSFLMIFLFNFIINCIDYSSLLNLSITSHNLQNVSLPQNNPNAHNNLLIYEYINLSRWFPSNPYLIICFSIYCIYLISLTGNIVSSIKKFSKIQKIYNKILAINDYRLKFLTWDDVVTAIYNRLNATELLDTSGINIYTINNRICHQTNLIISMIRSGYVSIPDYSKFLEWNYIFCIIEPMTTNISTLEKPRHSSQLENVQMLSETLNDINQLTNKDIFNRFTDNTKQPLLPLSMNEEIAYYENTQSTSSYQFTTSQELDYLDISSNSQSPNNTTNYTASNTTSNPTSVPTNNNIRNTTSNKINKIRKSNSLVFVSDSIMHTNQFDNILYNTLTTDIRTPVNSIIEYLQKVHYRINLVIAINLIAMPFTIIILGLYVFIKYGEKLYGNPSILFQRRINIAILWKLRYYNELPNLFRERITRIEANMDKIINAYQSPIRQIITRFLVFLIGSVFLLLLTMSFIASEDFVKLEIIPNHNIIWFLGVCGTILLILNKFVTTTNSLLTKKEQLRAFDALREDLISIYPQLNKIEDREYIVSLIHDIYKPRIVNIIYEVINLILSPIIIYRWKNQVAKNVTEILSLIEHHYQLGIVCRHSIFTNRSDIIRNPHMLLSLKEFRINHEWDIPDAVRIDYTLNNSVLLQDTIL